MTWPKVYKLAIYNQTKLWTSWEQLGKTRMFKGTYVSPAVAEQHTKCDGQRDWWMDRQTNGQTGSWQRSGLNLGACLWKGHN